MKAITPNTKKYFIFSVIIAVLFILSPIGMFVVSPLLGGVEGLTPTLQNLVSRGSALLAVSLPLVFLSMLIYGLFHLKKIEEQQKKELKKGILINLVMAVLSSAFFLLVFTFLFFNLVPN